MSWKILRSGLTEAMKGKETDAVKMEQKRPQLYFGNIKNQAIAEKSKVGRALPPPLGQSFPPLPAGYGIGRGAAALPPGTDCFL